MPCEKPMRAYKAADGRLVFFKSTQREYYIEPYSGLEIPCGYCILCREEQARQWAVRITHEANQHNDNAFLTLTYNDTHIPANGGLRYADLVKFWKRLRKHLGPLRYYAVGEYGDKTLRPHYHACVFGHSFTESRIVLRTTPTILWTSPLLERIWGLGNVSVGSLNFQTARYTASYVTKKLRQKQQYVGTNEETGELIPLEQPRAFMSRNLGKDWWKKFYHQVTAHDHVIIDGRRQKPPKAYDRWVGEKSEIALGMIKEERERKAERIKPEEARARARNARARVNQKSKTI